MNNFKKYIFGFLLVISAGVFAAGGADLQHANIDGHDKASLQNGARIYVNYCQGCHSIKYMRFIRMAEDLGLDEQEVKDNLMFVGEKIHDTMGVNMPPAESAKWFGVTPLDLSLVTRSRSSDWLYTYLISFYIDEKKPTGVNNTLFKDVGMPHVLAGLQGNQIAKKDKEGHITGLELQAGSGSMNAEEYDKTVNDLVNFLSYVAEPIKNKRETVGFYVIGVLLILLVFSYFLKKVYWKDIH